MAETFLPVVGFEGLYEISDHGNVRSCDKITRDGRFWRGREIGKHDVGSGYLQSVLSADGVYHHKYIHRMVAEAFVPNHCKKPEVNHKDGDKHNNNASNLEWATRKENAIHSARALGNVNGRTHRFTDDEVRAIRNDERSNVVIASEHGVTPYAIYQIKRRKTYANVSDFAVVW